MLANGTIGAQEIWVPGWRLPLTISGPGGDTQGDLDITESDVTIRGVGAGETIVDAGPLRQTNFSDRVFDVNSYLGTLTLNSLTITGGRAPALPPTDTYGGGIMVRSNSGLNLKEVAVVGNEASYGGAIFYGDGAGGYIESSVITKNSAANSTGGVYLFQPGTTGATVTVHVSNTIIAKNTAGQSNGGVDVLDGDYHQFQSHGYNRLTTIHLRFNATGDYYAPPENVSYVVTGVADTYDHSDDSIVMSLRDAITLANTTPGAEQIWLPAWNFVLTLERQFGQTTDMDASFGDLDIGIAPGQPISDASLTIRGVDGVTTVGWRPGAVADKVFELLGDYDPNLIVDSRDRYIYSVSLANHDLVADGDDDGDVDSNDLAVRDANYDNWLWMPGVTEV